MSVLNALSSDNGNSGFLQNIVNIEDRVAEKSSYEYKSFEECKGLKIEVDNLKT